jgi:hypothetical protein
MRLSNETDWWRAAKDAHIAWAEKLADAGQISDAMYSAMVARACHPDWVPERPEPRLPTLWRIVQHWRYGGVFRTDPAWPHCFACWCPVPGLEDCTEGKDRWLAAGSWLETGHLVNRARCGLDGVQNLVPLCRFCNRIMPIFDSPASPGPVEWVQAGGWKQYFEWTDDHQMAGRRVPHTLGNSVTIPLVIEGSMVPRNYWARTEQQRRKTVRDLARKREAYLRRQQAVLFEDATGA